MIGKFLTTATLTAGLTLGAAGTASAATTGGTTAAPAKCAHAQKVVNRLTKIDSRIAGVLPKLQAAETKASQAGHTKLAARIGKRINRLEHRQSTDDKRITKIEGRCPGVTGLNPSSTSSTGSSTA